MDTDNVVAYAMGNDDMAEPKYIMLIVPTICEEYDGDVYYDIDWDAIDWEDDEWIDNLPKKMSFTNIYTAHAYEPDTPDTPETGDHNNLALWLVLFAVSAAAIGTGVCSRRRRNFRTK